MLMSLRGYEFMMLANESRRLGIRGLQSPSEAPSSVSAEIHIYV